MKKLASVLTIAVCAWLLAVEETGAAGQVCFIPTNFCDRIELEIASVAGYTVVWGDWDYTCDGLNLNPVLGERPGLSFGTRPVVVGGTSPYVWNFILEEGQFTNFVVSLDDRVPDVVRAGEPYTLCHGPCASCPNGGVDTSKPRLASGIE